MKSLIDYARAEFELDRAWQGGQITVREQLTKVWQSRIRSQKAKSKDKIDIESLKPSQLKTKPLSSEVSYLYDWFNELRLTRTYTDSGRPNPLSFTEIDSWSRLTRKNLYPLEVEALRALDVCYLSTYRSDKNTQTAIERKK